MGERAARPRPTRSNKMNISVSAQAVVNGLKSVLAQKQALFKALAVPILLYFVALLVYELYGTSLSVNIITDVVTFLVFIYTSVTTHRIILLARERSGKFSLFSFGTREWQFFLAFFEAVFYCLPAVIFIFIPVVGEYVATVVGAYIVSRISLIFPSIAIDAPMRARASWEATSNYQLLMFTVVFVFSVFISAIEIGLSRTLVPELLIGLFSIITVIFLVGTLSEAYRTIMNEIANC